LLSFGRNEQSAREVDIPKGVGKNISGGEGQQKTKNGKKSTIKPKIPLLSLFQRRATEKRPKE